MKVVYYIGCLLIGCCLMAWTPWSVDRVQAYRTLRLWRTCYPDEYVHACCRHAGLHPRHTFPQKYRDRFEKLGINIDEPENVVWRKTEGHRAKNAEHGKEWDKFFRKNPSPTKEQVIEFRDKTEQKVWQNAPKGEPPIN